MALFTSEEVSAMYAPFPADEHQIREGNRSSNGDRIQWFVYLDRPAIQRRLEEVFPFEWEHTHTDAVEHSDKSFSASSVITIRGLKRGYNGAQSEMHGEHTPKGAVTDAFRRAASMWGIGFYVYEIPAIWTASYAKGDWDKKAKLEQEAMGKFTQWYNVKFGKPTNITPINRTVKTVDTPLTHKPDQTPAIETGLLATKIEYKVSGNNKFLVFPDAKNAPVLYTREPLRKLGDTWAEWADQLQPGKADLPAFVLLTTERKAHTETGEYYYVVTDVESAAGEGA